MTVGEHCIINTGAIVEHDNVIENYAHISPNVALEEPFASAHLPCGDRCNSENNTEICSDYTIGAGAVVVKT